MFCGTYGILAIIFFKGKTEEARIVWDRACQLSDDFRVHNLSTHPILPRPPPPRVRKWEKSMEGFFKINVEATVNKMGTGLGIITRDSDGFFLRGRCILK